MNVLFDTTIYYNLVSGTVSREKKEAIFKSARKNTITYFGSLIPIIEVANHIVLGLCIYDYYEILNEVDRLCGHNVLPHPHIWVRREIQRLLGLPLDNIEMRSCIKEFLAQDGLIVPEDWAGHFDEIEGGWVPFMNSFKDKVLEAVFEEFGYKNVVCGIANRKTHRVLIEVMEKPQNTDEEYVAYLSRNKAIDIPGTGDPSVRDAIISFKYYSTAYKALLRKQVRERKAFKINDYFDLEQTVYLNEMDYIVTEDRKMRLTFNAAFESAGLSKKLISFREFSNFL